MANERTLLRSFAAEQERRGLSRKTIEGRQRTLASFFRTLGDTPALAATRDQLRDFLDACDLGPRSRYTYLSTLTTFYAWAVDEGHAIVNPAATIRRPRQPRLVPRPIDTEDLVLALKAADARMRAWLCLGAFQGLRTVEMAGIARGDVLDGRRPPMLVVVKAKGGRERVLPLHEHTLAALRCLPMPQRGPVFRLADGTPIKAATIGSYIARFLHDLGIPASAHQLRHHFGSEVYRLSHDIRLTQELLGHASPSTTAVYAAWSPAAAVDVLAELGRPMA